MLMKKLICLCLLMVLCAVPVQAKTGDIAGTYYATDIVTTLNGFPIEAINIGGNTLIDAEAMAYYGFSVTWLPETRCLDITSFGEPHEMRPAAKGNARPVGAALGRYYETDIITSLDGEPITAYNIGGRTFLHAEEMAKLGYLVKWDGNARTLEITSPLQAGFVYSIKLTKGEAVTEEGCGSFSVLYTPDDITTTGDANYFNSTLSFDGRTWCLRMSFYQNEGLFHAEPLLQKLDSMKSFDVTGYECNPVEKYDLIGQSIILTINGEQAENIRISRSQGNGHVDFELAFGNIPPCTHSELRELHFSLV